MLYQNLLLFGLLAISPVVTGQSILINPDSIGVKKPKFLKNMYALSQPIEQEITIKTRSPKAESELPGSFFGKMAGGALTLFTGISTSTSEEAFWVMQNELISTNLGQSWSVPLYFEGEYMKTRERVNNDDGSTSLETQRGVSVDWSKGASGFIVEIGDTLGWFNLNTNPHGDSLDLYWLERLRYDGIIEDNKLEKHRGFESYRDLLVKGQLKNYDFVIISNNSLFRTLIIINGVPVAVFQREPNFVILKKKNKVHPYFLLNKDLLENTKMDLIRLGILSSLLFEIVSTDFHSN